MMRSVLTRAEGKAKLDQRHAERTAIISQVETLMMRSPPEIAGGLSPILAKLRANGIADAVRHQNMLYADE